MFEQPQQPVQGQTSQPNPQTQVPQNPQETDLQGAADQQALDTPGGAIQVPSTSDGTTTQQTVATQPSPDEGGFFADTQVGTGLLVATFVFAFTLLLVLARLAQRNSPQLAGNAQLDGEPALNSGVESAPINTEESPTLAAKKQKSAKKLTRRQRRAQK
jgi:hypothetical protein